MESDAPRLLKAAYYSFELDDLDIPGQLLVTVRDGKPTLAYRRTMSHRWSPEIMPNTPENRQSD